MSKIEWTERTWNPILGCAVVSPGCTNCYAMRTAHRLARNPATPLYANLTRVVNGKAVWTGEMRGAAYHTLTAPLRVRKPTTWFVNSMSDLFGEGVADSWLDQIFAVMAVTPHHTYQVLTKRADRMHAYLTGRPQGRWMTEMRTLGAVPAGQGIGLQTVNGTLPNLWLGVSAEDQRRADERIPQLLATPAAIRFVSIEPMLGGINLMSDLGGTQWIGGQRGCAGSHIGDGSPGCPRHPHHHHDARCRKGLDQVIVGGESGPDARPMHPDWVRSLRDQCAEARTPFFFKQWGEWAVHLDRDRDDDDWRADYRRFEQHPYCWLNLASGIGFHGERFHVMRKVGKKAAGRSLDGVQHDGVPSWG